MPNIVGDTGLKNVRHIKLCGSKQTYCGHPRQCGIYNFGGGKIAVVHHHAPSQYEVPNDVTHGYLGVHARSVRLLQRSLDGGETWPQENNVVIFDESAPIEERRERIFGTQDKPRKRMDMSRDGAIFNWVKSWVGPEDEAGAPKLIPLCCGRSTRGTLGNTLRRSYNIPSTGIWICMRTIIRWCGCRMECSLPPVGFQRGCLPVRDGGQRLDVGIHLTDRAEGRGSDRWIPDLRGSGSAGDRLSTMLHAVQEGSHALHLHELLRRRLQLDRTESHRPMGQLALEPRAGRTKPMYRPWGTVPAQYVDLWRRGSLRKGGTGRASRGLR